MTSPGDFADLFDPCRTMQETNKAYKQGVEILREAHRLSMVRIVKNRDSGESTGSKPRAAQNASEGPLAVDLAVQRSKDAQVRRWAQQEGISFRRVNKKLRAAYDEAHPE